MKKKKRNRKSLINNPILSHLFFVIFISFLPLVAFLINQDFFWTQDGWTHLARTASYTKGLLDGQLPVRWAGDLNYSYGMPLFNFTFQTPYFFMSLLTVIGFGLVGSLKIASATTYILAGVFMFLFSFSFFKNLKKALTATVFYQFFPFRIVDMTVRGSIGELFAFAFLPLALYSVSEYINTKKIRFLYFYALSITLLSLSHLATGAVFIAISILFIFMFTDSKKTSLQLLLAGGGGLLASAYYWVPAILEHKYTYGNYFAKDLYKDHFAQVKNLLFPNISNDESLRTGNVPVQIGILHITVFFVAILSFFTKKLTPKIKKLFVFCIALSVLALFLMSRTSSLLWEAIPTFRQFQFPWRFLSILSITTALSSASLFEYKFFQRKYVLILILFITTASTASYWVPQEGYRNIDEEYYWNYPQNTTYFGETDLIWSAGAATSYPDKPVEVIEGQATISDYYRKSNLHTYNVSSTEGARLVDRTQYYPGWVVLVNNRSEQIQFQDPNYPGQITFDIPKEKSRIEVKFTENKTRKLSNSISVVTIFAGALLLFIRKIRRHA